MEYQVYLYGQIALYTVKPFTKYLEEHTKSVLLIRGTYYLLTISTGDIVYLSYGLSEV